jgi:hypothetical protein
MKVIFDYRNSEKYGINAALVLETLIDLTALNTLKNVNEIDKKVWIYVEGGQKVLVSDYLPFLTGMQLETALKKLEKYNCIKIGSFNKFSSDRTYWYSLNPELFEEQILEKAHKLKKSF